MKKVGFVPSKVEGFTPLEIGGRQKRKKSLTGFTLLELLLATAIIAIIMAAIASSFVVGINAYERSKEKIEFNREVRFGLNRITRMLNSSYLLEAQEAETLFQTEDEQTSGYDNDRITFLAAFTPNRFLTEEPGGGLVEISYFIEREEGESAGTLQERLNYTYYVEREEAELNDTQRYETTHTLLDGIAGLNFRYFNGEEWQDGWEPAETDEMPKSVEITLTLIRNDEEISFTTASFIPMSNKMK